MPSVRQVIEARSEGGLQSTPQPAINSELFPDLL